MFVLEHSFSVLASNQIIVRPLTTIVIRILDVINQLFFEVIHGRLTIDFYYFYYYYNYYYYYYYFSSGSGQKYFYIFCSKFSKHNFLASYNNNKILKAREKYQEINNIKSAF